MLFEKVQLVAMMLKIDRLLVEEMEYMLESAYVFDTNSSLSMIMPTELTLSSIYFGTFKT